jgi:hypothetical protein
MARETKTIEVGGNKYEIKQLGGTAGRRLFHRLMRTAGPKLANDVEQIAEIVTNPESIGEIKAAAKLSGLFINVIAAIPEDLEEAFFTAFISNCKWLQSEDLAVQLNVEIFDDHFAGNPLGQDAWLVQCMKHNFVGFLSSAPKQPS